MGGSYVAEFETLKYQLGLVKDELSPFGWVQYVEDYKEKQYTERRLRKMQEEEDLREDTPRWKVRWDRLMLCEHLKKKLVVAHRTFTEAGALLMNSHELLVKDYNTSETFVDAITRIPSSTNDEVEVLGLRIDELKEQKKEVDEALDKLLTENRQKKEQRIERAEVTAKRVMLRRILTTLTYQNQRREVLSLRHIRDGLDRDLKQAREQTRELQRQFDEAQDDWDKKREALEKELARYKALHEKHQREAERTLRELEKTKASGQKAADQLETLLKEKQALLYKMATLEDQIDKLTEDLNFATQALAQKEEECDELKVRVVELEAIEEELREQVAGLEDQVADLEEKLEDMTRKCIRLTEEFRGFRERANHEQADVAAMLWRTRDNAREMERQLREEIQDGHDREDALAARINELEQDKVNLTLLVEETQRKADEEIAATKKWAAEEIKRKQEELEHQYADEKRALITRVHILTKEVESADDLYPHLRPLNDLPAYDFQKTNVCLHCRKYLVHTGMIEGSTGKPTAMQSWPAGMG